MSTRQGLQSVPSTVCRAGSGQSAGGTTAGPSHGFPGSAPRVAPQGALLEQRRNSPGKAQSHIRNGSRQH